MPRAHHLIELFKRKAFASFRFTQPLFDSRPYGQKFRGFHFLLLGLEECGQSLLSQGIGAGKFPVAEFFFDASLERGIEGDLHPALDCTALLLFGQQAGTSQETCVDLAGDEVGMGEDFLVQGDRGIDAFDDEHVECAAHAGDGFRAVGAEGD